MENWYNISNVHAIDTPALIIYGDRVKENISQLLNAVPDAERLRPHIKTHKSPDITQMLLEAGIRKFKCATIAEAEMLALAGAPDVLLAYQPVGPRIERLARLVQQYPDTTFSCLLDNIDTANQLNAAMLRIHHCLPVYLDLNVGMNRTGINPGIEAVELFEGIKELNGLLPIGLHAYDGHIRDQDITVRKGKCDAAFEPIQKLRKELAAKGNTDLAVIAGGSPTFPIHAQRPEVECSPGTFIYWDKGYNDLLPEQPFKFAVLVISRIVSIPADDMICTDLGHKAIASENPLHKRVFFLNAPDIEPVAHSEEHMIWKTSGKNTFKVGDVLYGVPYHVCPTCALYGEAFIVSNNKVLDVWTLDARNRKIRI